MGLKVVRGQNLEGNQVGDPTMLLEKDESALASLALVRHCQSDCPTQHFEFLDE